MNIGAVAELLAVGDLHYSIFSNEARDGTDRQTLTSETAVSSTSKQRDDDQTPDPIWLVGPTCFYISTQTLFVSR